MIIIHLFILFGFPKGKFIYTSTYIIVSCCLKNLTRKIWLTQNDFIIERCQQQSRQLIDSLDTNDQGDITWQELHVIKSNKQKWIDRCYRSHIAGTSYVWSRPQPLFSTFLLNRAPEAPGEYKLNVNVCLKFHTASILSCTHGYRGNVPQRTDFA